MRNITHATFAVTAASLSLGTPSLMPLLLAAIASQLPDADTSKSVPGQVLFPLSAWLEKRYPHRTITHSFLATAVIALLTLPMAFLTVHCWQALVLGYFCGWFADTFTKSGVAAFYPSAARLVIPANPRLRLSTGSSAEYFILAILAIAAVASIYINSSGGILRNFSQALGIPSGAVEIASADSAQYLLTATVHGRTSVTQQPVNGEFEVVRPLTQTDLLLKDTESRLYRAGTSQECQILVSRITVQRKHRVRSRVQDLQLQDQTVADVMPKFSDELAQRAYVNGTLVLEDAEDLVVPTRADAFDAITLQPGQGIMIVRLESANPTQVLNLLGDYYAQGSLIVRVVEVL